MATTATLGTPEKVLNASAESKSTKNEQQSGADLARNFEGINQRRSGHKRKRKTEKQLACLQNELRGGNLLWSREKIIDISEKSGMSETQIYKWWWDQTRKRLKKLKKAGFQQSIHGDN